MTHRATWLAAAVITFGAVAALAHGDMAPQAVDTAGLPDLPDEMASENPWRETDDAVTFAAISVGSKGYNSNCARCHGLEAISGGLAPDLRFLEANEFGDEWYLDRVQNGYTQNGAVKMPPFDDILSQEAIWAIRLYTESRADEVELADLQPTMKQFRDELSTQPDAARLAAMAGEMSAATSGLETLSGAPRALTALDEAAYHLSQDPPHSKEALDALSAAISN